MLPVKMLQSLKSTHIMTANAFYIIACAKKGPSIITGSQEQKSVNSGTLRRQNRFGYPGRPKPRKPLKNC